MFGAAKTVQFLACACFEQLGVLQSMSAYGGAVPPVLVSEASHWRGGHSRLLELALLLCRYLLNCHLQPTLPPEKSFQGDQMLENLRRDVR